MQAGPPSPRPGDAARPAELWTVLPAVADSVLDTRHRLEEWLRDLRWPAKERIGIVVAVNEALANVSRSRLPAGLPSGASSAVCLASH